MQGFFSLLNYVIPEALPPSLMGSALAGGRSILESALSVIREASGSFSQKRPLYSPCHQNPAVQTECTFPI